MKSKKEIAKAFKEHYSVSKSGLKNQYKHIKESQAFYAGDYMNYRDRLAFGRGSSRVIRDVSFNRVKPYVNAVVGFMAQQRRKPFYEARVSDAVEQKALSEYQNGLSDYVRENNNADSIETKQDLDLVIGGIGVTDTAISERMGFATRDPNGEILLERVNPLHVGWDPASISPNLIDSRWVYRTKEYDVEEAEQLFGKKAEDFETITHDYDDLSNLQFNPFGGIQDKIGYEWSSKTRKLVRVHFYQWFEVENYYRVENPLLLDNVPVEIKEAIATAFLLVESDPSDNLFRFDPAAELLVMTKENRSKVKEIFEMFDLTFDPVTAKRKVFYTAIVSGDRVYDSYKSPDQQGYTLKFKIGDRDEVNKMYTGIVKSLIDPQKYYNKSLTELMLIIANNSRGGVIFEEDAVENVREFEAKWAMVNSAVKVNKGALSGNKIQPKATPQQPTGYEAILATSSEAMGQVTGIDESFFGAIGGGNETAMLQRQRIKQATTTLAVYFDSLQLYTKEQARLMQTYMRLLAEAGEGSVFSVRDPDGNTVFEYLSTDFFADEYEITIGEAPDTPTQKEAYTQLLMNMAQSMQAIGDPRYLQMYAAAVKYMPFDNRDKNDIIRVLLGNQQFTEEQVQQVIAPLQQQINALTSQQAQIMQAETVADINKKNADTQKVVEETRKTRLDIEETVEDIEKKAIENDILAMKPMDDVNATI